VGLLRCFNSFPHLETPLHFAMTTARS